MQSFSDFRTIFGQPELKGAVPFGKSASFARGGWAVMARKPDEDIIVSSRNLGFPGELLSCAGSDITVSRLSHECAAMLRELFPYTGPRPVLGEKRSFGVGDRLGIAAPGHIRVFEKYDALPVLAQQSRRELNLTGRSFDDVLDCATFGVFREGFRRGFGADGDHLKTHEEVADALSRGYTMITLDCSGYIRTPDPGNDGKDLPERLKEDYLGKTFRLSPESGLEIVFSEKKLADAETVYGEAVRFISSVYDRFFRGKEDSLDFEISIDETSSPTSPEDHFFVACELSRLGIKPKTMAPRFCGEFQKGIDYIGDTALFEKEFAVHAEIARHFGYKLSIHSGSDKFSVFPAIGRHTRGVFHVKTAGTNWLEAVAVAAERDPALFRRIFAFAAGNAFAEAKKYYHVSADPSLLPDIGKMRDEDLPGLFSDPNVRQVLHITYGQILGEKDGNGPIFRNSLFSLWRVNEQYYHDRIEKHIGKHLELLYGKNCENIK